MKDANEQYLKMHEAQEMKDDLEQEEYQERLAATVAELRKEEGSFLLALQLAVENIDCDTLTRMHEGYKASLYMVQASCIGADMLIKINYEIDQMAKDIIGVSDES